MKKLIRMATSIMAMALMSGLPLFAHAQSTPSETSATQNADWTSPPAGTDQAKQGYRDGIEAAKLDQAAKRPIDAKVSHLYVHPPVKGAARDEYRASFASGYDAAVKHSSGM
jgi:hypothetical protein